MSQLLDEYKAYYAARAQRYAGNPAYRHSHAAESALSEAMQSCNALEEFKDKIGDLNERAAIALIKDEHLQEQAHFDRHQEPIRKQVADKVLSQADAWSNVTEAITAVQEITQAASLQISADEAHRDFLHAWDQLDDLRAYQNAEVPEEYKGDMARSADEIRRSVADRAHRTEADMQKFVPDFRLQSERMNEARHRRLVPYADSDMQDQLHLYQQITQR